MPAKVRHLDLEAIERDKRAALGYTAFALLAGMLFLLAYSTATRSGAWVGLQLLVAAAAAISGALLGFLFGIPRMLQAPEAAPSAGEDDKTRRNRKLLNYQSNTNLEQISDWLTKILVGVGLTQLHEIGAALQSIARFAVGPRAAADAVGATSAAIIYFVVAGFFLGYLWTRLVYSRLLVSTEFGILQQLEVLEERNEALEEEKVTLAAAAKSAATKGVGKATALRAGSTRTEQTVGRVPEGIDVELPPIRIPADPNKGRFGGKAEANGLAIGAKVSEMPDLADWFLIELEVKPTNASRKLDAPVIYYLHPTFREPVETVEPVGNTARLELMAYGAFTVGVIADGGRTLLELDLAELPSAPRTFRER